MQIYYYSACLIFFFKKKVTAGVQKDILYDNLPLIWLFVAD